MSIDYGKALTALREDMGLSRADFCEKAGISRQRLSQLENNKYKNTELSIKKVLKSLHIDFSEFLVVYGGYQYDDKSFNSLEELKDYKKQKENMPEHQRHESAYSDSDEEYQVQDFIDTMDYLQHEASTPERRLVVDLVKFFNFRKNYEKDFYEYLNWKQSKNRTPE